jgi:MFS family permease
MLQPHSSNDTLERRPYWRWLIILNFSLCISMNGLMGQNFSSATTQAMKLFDIDEVELEWQYSIQYLAIAIATLPAAYYVEKNLPLTQWLFALVNTISAYLRYHSVDTRNYNATVVASAILGVSGALGFTAFAYISARCFSDDLQSRATNFSVQSTNAGFLGAMLLIPYAITATKTEEIVVEYKALCFWQGVVSCFLLLLSSFLFVYIQQPRAEATTSRSNHGKVPEEAAEAALFFKPLTRADLPEFFSRKFILTTFCFTTLQSAAYGIPGIVDNIFVGLGFSTQDAAWANCALIIGGVVAGIGTLY